MSIELCPSCETAALCSKRSGCIPVQPSPLSVESVGPEPEETNDARDAARYRWLRENTVFLDNFFICIDAEVEAFVDEMLTALRSQS